MEYLTNKSVNFDWPEKWGAYKILKTGNTHSIKRHVLLLLINE